MCIRDRNKAKGIEKHEASISRARSVVFQLAMCNSWEYFFTGTLNPEWHDRHNLDRFRSAFAQWIRDQRKKYRSNIRYVFVAERHKDGAWHLHGLLSGIPQDRLSRFVPGIHPRRLVDGDYLNWGDYAKKFGFCSLGPVHDEVGCAFYLEKYLTKDVERSVSDLSAHTYTCLLYTSRAEILNYFYVNFSRPRVSEDGRRILYSATLQRNSARGEEMCIRDRRNPAPPTGDAAAGQSGGGEGERLRPLLRGQRRGRGGPGGLSGWVPFLRPGGGRGGQDVYKRQAISWPSTGGVRCAFRWCAPC